MNYPIIEDYISSLQSADENMATRQSLRQVMDSTGNPVMSSGNYAVVFKMVDIDTGRNYAMKCFLRDQEGREESYMRICEELEYVESPHLLRTEYLPGELFVPMQRGDEEEFPVLLMDWVEGITLGSYMSAHYSDPVRMSRLCYSFSKMASWLMGQDFAHGDIKPDNIIVKADGNLVLVDYDGMFVPSMKGTPARENGSPNFRHPGRTEKDFDRHVDDFALTALALTLKILSLSPDSFPTIQSNDFCLFSEKDYLDITRAVGRRFVESHLKDTDVQRLWGLFLIALCEKQLPPIPFRLSSPPSRDMSEFSPEPRSTTYTVNGVPFTMVRVEGGTFTMGATPEQGSDAFVNEAPTHKVTLDGFSIGETEVTQALWTAVMGSNPSYHKGDNYPVEQVTWDDCQTFISKLNSLTGKSFRLPTEAEWEFAARGGNLSRGYKYSGSNDINSVAWFEDNSGDQTHAVKTKSPNELGLYDMNGNVYEWCSDWYGAYSSSPQTNPRGPGSGSDRVFRGGSYYSDARCCRVSLRLIYGPTFRLYDLGLRLAL